MSIERKNQREHGVAPVVGFLLVTAIIIITAVQYQNNVVPTRQTDTEAAHFSEVERQMVGLQSAIRKTAASGQLQSETVRTGVTYDVPGITPPPVQGTILTKNVSTKIKIENARNEGSASNYWSGNGDAKKYPVDFLEYRIEYNRVSTNPTTGYEYGILYNNFTRGNPANESTNNYVIVAKQQVVRNRNINLYSTTGDIAQSSSGEVTVQSYPTSAPANSISVTDNSTAANTNKRIEITVPTQLPLKVWQNKILEDEMDDPTNCRLGPSTPSCQPGGDEGYVAGVEEVGDDKIKITMESGQKYNLRLARAHLTTRATQTKIPSTNATYVAWPGGRETNIREGETTTLNVQARDRYNNGVLGTRMLAEAKFISSQECAGNFRDPAPEEPQTCTDGGQENKIPGEKVSGENGNAFFVYDADTSQQDRELTFSLYLDDS